MTSHERRTNAGTQAAWGRAKIAGGPPAMAIAIPAGMLIGAALGLVAAATGIAGDNRVLVAVVFGICLSVPSIALVYALVVDRMTIRGAVERAEESVESGWYQRASSGALTDVVLIAGVGVLVFSFVEAAVPANLLLAAVVLAAMASVAIRYAIARRRG